MRMVVAAILAGGYGKRLKPLTESIPKPLVEIGENFTILDKQILDYKYAGIREVYLLVGYMWEKIRERYARMWRGVQLHYIVEDEPQGTLYALRNLFRDVQDDVFVSNGDVVADFNLREMMKFSAQNDDALITIAVTRMRSPYGIVEFRDGRILRFLEKPILEYYINAGFYYIKRAAQPYFFREYEDRAVEKTVFPHLAELGKAYVYPEYGVFWQSVDSFKDLERVRKEFRYREEYPWGYIKSRREGEIVYIKKGYPSASIQMKNATVIVKRGACRILSPIQIELREGEEIGVGKGEYVIEALENTLLVLHQST